MERKFNVILTSPWYPNKDDKFEALFIQRHAKLIASNNNLVVCISKKSEKNIKKFEINQYTENNILHFICYYQSCSIPYIKVLINGFRFFKAQYKSIKLGKKYLQKIDFFHVNVLTRASIIPFCYNFFYGIPYFISEQATRYSRSDVYKGVIRKLITKIILKNALGLSVISNYLKNTMINVGLVHQNTMIIPNCVDCNMFKYKVMNKTGKRFLHVSRMEQKAKNVFGIINSFCVVQNEYPDVELHMVGDGPEKSIVENYVNINDIKNVWFYGDLEGDDLIYQYQIADLFILFSNYETQAVVACEALSCGLPVISTRIPAVEEYLNQGNSRLINMGDESGLTKCLLQFLEKQISFCSPEIIQNEAHLRFREELITKKFNEFYHKGLDAK